MLVDETINIQLEIICKIFFSVFFSGKCGPGDLCFTMLEQMENIDTKLGDYGEQPILLYFSPTSQSAKGVKKSKTFLNF